MSSQPREENVFNETACTRCGDCFHLCPELKLPIDIAKQEMINLIEGKKSQHVLAHCTTCRSCNHLCPHGCKPYQLILERWNDLYQRRGAPPIYTVKNNAEGTYLPLCASLVQEDLPDHGALAKGKEAVLNKRGQIFFFSQTDNGYIMCPSHRFLGCH